MGRNQIEGSQKDDGDVAVADEEEDIKTVLGKAIAVTVADAGVLRKTVTVTVPRDNIQKEVDREFKDLIKESIVPGFRRGRAPRRLIEKRYGGEVGTQVQTRLVSNAYMAAIEKEDLKVLGDPMMWVREKGAKGKDGERLMDMPTALQQMRLPEDGPLEFRCEVEVKPQFTVPTLEGVEVERPDLTITDDDVSKQIDRIRARRGHWAPVADGKVQEDDLLICDVTLMVDGKEAKKEENMQLFARPQVIEGMTFQDFGEKLKGAKAGDVRRLEGEIQDDFEVEELRGKKGTVELKLNELKRIELPPLDKDYLSNMGFDSEKDYRDWVRKQMTDQLEVEIKRGMRGQVRKYLLESTKLDLPEGISSRQTERAVMRKAMELRQRGVPEAEIMKHADELKTIAREEVTTELKLYFIIEEIAESEKIEVSEEEINAEIAAIARSYNRRFDRVRDDLAKANGIESLYLQIRDDKCIDGILAKAKIVKTDPSKKPTETPKKASETKAKKADPAEKAEKPKKEAAPKAEKPKAEKKPAKGKS
ncbi:MAG: trigger factor [Planctomycetota bacterium]